MKNKLKLSIVSMVLFSFHFAFAKDGIEGVFVGSTESQVLEQFYRRCEIPHTRELEAATGVYKQSWNCFGDKKKGFALTVVMGSETETGPLSVSSIQFHKQDSEGRLFTNHGITIGDTFKRVKGAYNGQSFKVFEESNPFQLTYSDESCSDTYCEKQVTYTFKKVKGEDVVTAIYFGPLGE